MVLYYLSHLDPIKLLETVRTYRVPYRDRIYHAHVSCSMVIFVLINIKKQYNNYNLLVTVGISCKHIRLIIKISIMVLPANVLGTLLVKDTMLDILLNHCFNYM